MFKSCPTLTSKSTNPTSNSVRKFHYRWELPRPARFQLFAQLIALSLTAIHLRFLILCLVKTQVIGPLLWMKEKSILQLSREISVCHVADHLWKRNRSVGVFVTCYLVSSFSCSLHCSQLMTLFSSFFFPLSLTLILPGTNNLHRMWSRSAQCKFYFTS